MARAPAPLTNYPEGSTKQTIGSLSVSYDFGAVTLRSITGYVKTEDFFSNDFSGNGLVMAANTAEAEQLSEELQLLGKGADRGGSSASMDLTATVEPGETAGTSVLVGVAAVIVNGKFAQFGGRLMVQVSDMLLAQFADNFRAAAAALTPPAVADAAAPGEAAPAAAAAAAPAKANEINGLAIVWSLVKSWLAGLFGKRA